MNALLSEPTPYRVVQSPPYAPTATIRDELDGMTKAELLNYADENGVGGVSSAMKRADIIAAIVEAVG